MSPIIASKGPSMAPFVEPHSGPSGQFEDVAKKGPVGICIGGENDDMRAVEHRRRSYHRIYAVVAALLILAAPIPAVAQSGPQSCATLGMGIEFCGGPERWAPTAPRADNVVARYRNDEGAFGLIQTDDLGTADGMMPILLRAAILDSFGGAGPVNVIATDVSELDGRPAERIAFSGNTGGAPFVAAGTYWVGEDKWILALTWSPGHRLGKVEQVLHDEFVSLIRIGDDL